MRQIRRRRVRDGAATQHRPTKKSGEILKKFLNEPGLIGPFRCNPHEGQSCMVDGGTTLAAHKNGKPESDRLYGE